MNISHLAFLLTLAFLGALGSPPRTLRFKLLISLTGSWRFRRYCFKLSTFPGRTRRFRASAGYLRYILAASRVM